MTSPTPPADPWVGILLGQSLGPYEVLRHINEGGFGHVFEAKHVTTDALVAVKVLKVSPSAEATVEFENEAILLRQLSGCEGVINFVDFGVDSVDIHTVGGVMPVDVRYLVLSRASGSLDEISRDPVLRDDLSLVDKLRLWRDVIKGLRQMHAGGIVHRDLKCSNCLLFVRGNLSAVKLGDLGRSKDLALPVTKALEHYVLGRGDVRFAAPEYLYLLGEPTAGEAIAADYYGLGSILVELITGQSMTSLAFSDIHSVIDQAKVDYFAGRSRDLSVLVGRYRSVTADIVALLPPRVRSETSMIIGQLCHPLPVRRSQPSPFRRDRLDRDGLHWILKRVDIMIKQLDIDARAERRIADMERKSA